MIVATKEYTLTSSSIEDGLIAGWSFLGITEEPTPCILNTLEGVSIALFHFGMGCEIPAIAWEADVIVCCHPQLLPLQLREKHAFPNWRGCVGTQPLEAARVLPFIVTIDDNDYI